MKNLDKLFTYPGRNVTTFETMKRLCEKLGHPYRSYKTVHVAGTNGKGSVCTKIAKALQSEGFSTGLYTSPHIDKFNERIQVDGHCISDSDADEILDHLFDIMEGVPSFFDLLTAAAFVYFARKRVDWAVVEVGLGGRLDATNVITPELAVIASIGFDHCAILGSTLDAIAKEKGGIAKPGVPLLVGPSAAPFFPSCLSSPAAPDYDTENSLLAKLALEHLKISESSIQAGIQIRPPCRFEKVGNAILDAAHNPSGFEKLAQALKHTYPGEKFHFIVAFSQDKDFVSCLEAISPISAAISLLGFVPVASHAIDQAFEHSPARPVICGSFYILSEARLAIQRREGLLQELTHR
jgi:dihydrofolate synthase/folylpolyglutamate synthase